jgi:Ca2+-binding RTX toxin-like protein
LAGNSGNDILKGGNGQDSLSGGDGKDIFSFGGGKQTTNKAPDLVTDFSHAEGDKIDLAAAYSGNFSFIGTQAFSKVAGQLHYAVSGEDALVSGDINGDGKGDFTIELTGVTSLVKGDFVL